MKFKFVGAIKFPSPTSNCSLLAVRLGSRRRLGRRQRDEGTEDERFHCEMLSIEKELVGPRDHIREREYFRGGRRSGRKLV